MQKKNNHQLMQEGMAQRIAAMDMDFMAKRLGLAVEDDLLSIPLLDMDFRVNRLTGECLQLMGDGTFKLASPNAAAVVYDILAYSRGPLMASGEYIRLQNLPKVFSSNGNAADFICEPLAKVIDKAPEAFRSVCLQLGEEAPGKGDMNFKLPVFDCIQVVLGFWESDEDFDASLCIFFDSCTLENMHYETACILAMFVMSTIEERMALED